MATLPAGVGRLALFVALFVALSIGVHLSGWSGPDQLQSIVQTAGWGGVLIFILGYAVLTMLPTPASLLTILAGALYGLWWGTLVALAGALLGAAGGFLIGRRLGRPVVDRMLKGRLRQADELLTAHGLVSVLTARLLPLFPFTALNYACGLLGVRRADYLWGSAVGMVPGALAYAALGASGADPRGIAVGATGLLLLSLLGGVFGRRLLRLSADTPATNDDR